MPYAVRLNRRAQKQLDRVPISDADRVMDAILALTDNPRPHGAVKLGGSARRWRLRVGSYRVVYDIFDPDEMVNIEHILRRTTRTYKDI